MATTRDDIRQGKGLKKSSETDAAIVTKDSLKDRVLCAGCTCCTCIWFLIAVGLAIAFPIAYSSKPVTIASPPPPE